MEANDGLLSHGNSNGHPFVGGTKLSFEAIGPHYTARVNGAVAAVWHDDANEWPYVDAAHVNTGLWLSSGLPEGAVDPDRAVDLTGATAPDIPPPLYVDVTFRDPAECFAALDLGYEGSEFTADMGEIYFLGWLAREMDTYVAASGPGGLDQAGPGYGWPGQSPGGPSRGGRSGRTGPGRPRVLHRSHADPGGCHDFPAHRARR